MRAFDEVKLVVVFLVLGRLFLLGLICRDGFSLWEHFLQLTDEYLVVHQVVYLLGHTIVLDQVWRVCDFAQ